MFAAAVYVNGEERASCSVWQGDRSAFGGICYAWGDTSDRSSTNESLSVVSEGDSLSLRSLGITRLVGKTQSLGVHGVAEYLWELSMEQVQ
jgi:hypothetical protein